MVVFVCLNSTILIVFVLLVSLASSVTLVSLPQNFTYIFLYVFWNCVYLRSLFQSLLKSIIFHPFLLHNLVESSDFDFSFQSRVSTSFSSVHGRKDLHHFTIAFWMRTSDLENDGTPISYATQRNGVTLDDNALVLNDYSNFRLVINNKTANLGFDANDGEWHHVAVTWTSTTGLWKTFKDGRQINRLQFSVTSFPFSTTNFSHFVFLIIKSF